MCLRDMAWNTVCPLQDSGWIFFIKFLLCPFCVGSDGVGLVALSEYICRGQRTAPGSQFSPSPMRVPGIELGSPGLAASALPTEPSRLLHPMRVRLPSQQQLTTTSSL